MLRTFKNLVAPSTLMVSILLTLSGCGGRNSSPQNAENGQGAAKWAKPNTPRPAEPQENTTVDSQKAARDLGILIPAPGESQQDSNQNSNSNANSNESGQPTPPSAVAPSVRAPKKTAQPGADKKEEKRRATKGKVTDTKSAQALPGARAQDGAPTQDPIFGRRQSTTEIELRQESEKTKEPGRVRRFFKRILGRDEKQDENNQSENNQNENNQSADPLGQGNSDEFSNQNDTGTSSNPGDNKNDSVYSGGFESQKPGTEKQPPAENSDNSSEEQKQLARMAQLEYENNEKIIADIRNQIVSQYLNRAQYPRQLIKQYIDSIASLDRKITKTVTYGQSNPQTITFVNESERLVKAFESMVITQGEADVPFYNMNGELIETVRLKVGGDLAPTLEGKVFQYSNGEACESVLCALANIFEVSEDINEISRDRMTSRLDAAYDSLFIFFHHHYIITAMVPRLERETPAEYSARKSLHRVMTTDQVALISETLWELPRHYSRMPTLLYIWTSLENASTSGSRPTATLMSNDLGLFSYYFHSAQNKRPTIGFTIFHAEKWGRYLHDQNININYCANGKCERISRKLTEEEVDWYEPDFRDRRSRDWKMTVVHELTHALDKALGRETDLYAVEGLDVENMKDQGLIKGRLPFSMGADWRSLSGWMWLGANGNVRTYNQFDRRNKRDGLPMSQSTMTTDSKWSTSGDFYKNFVWSYGLTNPGEDFAVHAETYFRSTDELTSLTPAKAQFLKDYIFNFKANGETHVWTYKNDQYIRDQYASFSEMLKDFEQKGKGWDFYSQAPMSGSTSGFNSREEPEVTETVKMVSRDPNKICDRITSVINSSDKRSGVVNCADGRRVFKGQDGLASAISYPDGRFERISN